MSISSSSFGSLRSKNRPLVRRPSFRDDTSLVAIRYEKTTQREAPVPIPARNPSRLSRPASSSSSASYRPVVVVPPAAVLAQAQAQGPPTEEHPAFRKGPVLPPHWVATGAAVETERKRDSGHGSASCPSSTPTIDEEECEHEFPPYSPKISPVLPVVRHSQDARPADVVTIDTDYVSVYSDNSRSTNASPASDYQTQSSPTIDSDSESAQLMHTISSCLSASAQKPSPEPTPSLAPFSTPASPLESEFSEKPRHSKLVRSSFSFRSVASSLMRSDSRSTKGSGRWRGDGDGKQGREQGAHSESVKRGQLPPKSSDNRATYSLDDHCRSLELPLESTKESPNALSSLLRRNPFQSHSRRPNTKTGTNTLEAFSPLSVSIPTDNLLDDDFLNGLTFSKRGSVMLGGRRALSLDGAITDTDTMADQPPTQPLPEATQSEMQGKEVNATPDIVVEATPTPVSAARSSSDSSGRGYVTPDAEPTPLAEPSNEQQLQLPEEESAPSATPSPHIRVFPAEMERESQKVRSLYLVGDADLESRPRPSLGDRREPPIAETSGGVGDAEPSLQSAHPPPVADTADFADSSSLLPPDPSMKDPKLVGGGYEDWDDLDGAYVDRYGFITNSRPTSSRLGTPTETRSAQFQPRRRNVLQKRHGLSALSALGDMRPPSRKVSARSLNTHHSGLSTTSLRSSRSVIRQAGNLLPHNRDRRFLDEAGDMLSSSPSLQDIAEEARLERITEALKRREWERSEKWRKMAKNVKKGGHGEGMEFEFDVENPKLIERTWKGIPDRWRASAWWSFMATSAKAQEGSPTDTDIIVDFHKLLGETSPDDMQIDLDVPRTISRHIMFRRRYEGGQRLLFRVLHALSIYFPDTGYVQGMASLAATLLCYFDEEKCFVMLVRMWLLRGLQRLYAHGFEGLMAALNEFETTWLNKDVAKKLTDLGIDATAYGTRWYLTLFNLSIPFPAQLRVWDVFLLLGPGTSAPAQPGTTGQGSASESAPAPTPEPTGLAVLHATSAAVIQALREVLIDSDFENAMKALTSSIPIRDEDLLMRVTRAEWKSHRSKKRG